MRVAVCHDRLTERSGGERVAIVLAQTFRADLFVAKYNPATTFEIGKDVKVFEISPASEPPVSQLYTLLWMRDALRFSKLTELQNYDLVITSGQLAHFASVQNPTNIWYCHTPNRALYDLRVQVKARLGTLWKPLFDIWCAFWKPFDQNSVRHVRLIVVNSKNVRDRVMCFYGRESTVVYPPVDIRKFRYRRPENFWLSVQRVEPEKRIEIQLKAFERMPDENLVLVGPGKYHKEYVQKIKSWVDRMPNVTWLGSVREKELIDLYSRCRGVIQTPVDEDFGLIAVEAMASGKPCIAVDEGGFKETVIQGKTGVLIRRPYVKNLVRAIRDFDRYHFSPKVCRKQAEKFSEQRFKKEMIGLAKHLLNSVSFG